VGFLSGIFGNGPSLDTSASQGYLNTLGNLGVQAQANAGQANSNYQAINGNYLNSLNQYANYLSANPATDQYNAAQVANATQGNAEAAQRAKGALAQDLASRGISVNSGIGAGALSGIDTGLAQAVANAQNQAAQNNIDRKAANERSLAELWSGAQGTAFGQNESANGQAANIYGNLFNDSNTLADEQYQGQLQSQAGDNQLLGAFGNIAGGLLKKSNPATGALSLV
jgi:hypothetical protein